MRYDNKLYKWTMDRGGCVNQMPITMKGLVVAIACLSVFGRLAAAEFDGAVPVAPVGECPPEDGDKPVYLPDSESRQHFYICKMGVPHRYRCPPGILFDPVRLSCSIIDRVSSIAPVGECPPVDGMYPTMLPDSERRDAFYICSNGRPYLKYCNPGLVFDPTYNVCVYP